MTKRLFPAAALASIYRVSRLPMVPWQTPAATVATGNTTKAGQNSAAVRVSMPKQQTNQAAMASAEETFSRRALIAGGLLGWFAIRNDLLGLSLGVLVPCAPNMLLAVR